MCLALSLPSGSTLTPQDWPCSQMCPIVSPKEVRGYEGIYNRHLFVSANLEPLTTQPGRRGYLVVRKAGSRKLGSGKGRMCKGDRLFQPEAPFQDAIGLRLSQCFLTTPRRACLPFQEAGLCASPLGDMAYYNRLLKHKQKAGGESLGLAPSNTANKQNE